MRRAYVGTLEEALAAARSGALADCAQEGFRRAYGRQPGEDEAAAWRIALPPVLEAASCAASAKCTVVLEYGLPFNGQRIDLLFIGGKAGRAAAHVVELKTWESSRPSPRLEHFVEAGGGIAPHPSYQALNYAGKLRYLHSFGEQLEVSQSAVIADGGPERHETLRSARFAQVTYRAPLFVAPELHGFKALVRENLPDAPSPEWVKAVLEGRYAQSGRLLDALRERHEPLLARASAVLAACGWGLSRDQLQVRDEILGAIERGDRAAFCVSGGPGSGKSLLAFHVFLGAIGLKKRAVLAVRNNRLMAVLRKILNEQLPGASGMLKYFSTSRRAGVEDAATEVADVLVCDEGQRLALGSENVFRRAPVTVIVYDEEQILNERERGTKANFADMCEKLGCTVHHTTLATPHRCRGGAAYVAWVNTLLAQPATALAAARPWSSDYVLEAAESYEDLIARLRYRPGRTGLFASFTRSSGRDRQGNPRDLGRIRVPETRPPVRWLMDPATDYVPFYLEGRSNTLERCASIYGAQGFELDYAGLIWGSDLVIRDGRWEPGDPDDCYDRAPGSRPLSAVMRQDRPLALRLLRNRYRILLTRGILGTVVYFEDAASREYFRRMSAPAAAA